MVAYRFCVTNLDKIVYEYLIRNWVKFASIVGKEALSLCKWVSDMEYKVTFFVS